MIPLEVLKAVKLMQTRETEILNTDFSWNKDCIPIELQGFINGIRFAKSELVKVYAATGENLLSELRDKWNDIEVETHELEN